MNFRTTGILLIVLVILGGVVYWLEGRPEDVPADAMPLVLDVKSEDIARITVRDGEKRVVLERAGEGTWTILEPTPGEADLFRVEDVLSRLATARITRSFDSANLAEYGLEPPRGEVTILKKDGTTLALLLGNAPPGGGSHYTRRPDQPQVVLIPSFVAADLLRLATDPPVPLPSPTPEIAIATPIGGLTPPPTATETATWTPIP